MKVGSVDTCDRVLVIAEIGNNHEGDLALARRMIRVAAAAGADAVKFQTIVPDRLVSADQSERRAQLRRFQFSEQDFGALAVEATAAGVAFLSTPFDVDSVAWLDPLVPAFKVASGDNDFFPLFDRIAATGKPVLVSLGFGGQTHAASIARYFHHAWQRYGVPDPGLALLHCVAAYPTPDDQADLGAIRALLGLGVTVGYSDHTLGIKAAELAVAAGARIVEKHFTLDKTCASFRDHRLSADPEDLRALVAAVRHAELMFRAPRGGAADASQVSARRSIAAARDLAVGATIAPQDLTWLRPGTGFRPGDEAKVVGRRLRAAVSAGHLFQPSDLE